MADKLGYYAIVAEYRDVAILEKRGDKRAVWKGKEYFTDGLAYIAYDGGGDDRGLLGLENELQVKQFIDAFRDHHHELPEHFRKPLMTYKQVWQYLYKRPFRGTVPLYVFDEMQGVFTRIDGVRDGQHRHGDHT